MKIQLGLRKDKRQNNGNGTIKKNKKNNTSYA
jgi:hypothetical protein